ncbi:MAG: septum site-determining protein MinC [bacterium]|nr:septum site-determining protein MinC [bacterium]
MGERRSMKDCVLIKSFPNGIALHLDAEAPFEQLLEEIACKFSEARGFFGAASMALSIEDRQITGAEEIRILDAVRHNSDLNIICIVGKDDATNKNFIKALTHVEKKLSGGDEGQFFKGSLKNKEVLETDNSIIILGDVYPGSAVISARNIIILGGLFGEAYAGGSGQPDAFVAALEMEPERIKIGDFKYKSTAKQSKWGIRPKVQPKIATVKDGKITFELFTKELLGTF